MYTDRQTDIMYNIFTKPSYTVATKTCNRKTEHRNLEYSQPKTTVPRNMNETPKSTSDI